MIEMKRVRLINWHNFVNNIIDFDQITYLVGVNAVGKTTILDAIRYCLTTSKNFNALGNKRSGRTLQGSIHGKQRDAHAYARPGHTVAYVGIEFLDQEKASRFVITVRVESEDPEQEMRYVRQTWYISPKDYALEDLPFLDAATNQPSTREQFSLKNEKMPPIDRQRDAQEKICRRLGLGGPGELSKKFGEVFAMGTSVEEISDFKTFVYDYILPQPEIDLEAMQQDQIELEKLEEVLTNTKHKAEQLKQIIEVGQKAQEKKRDVQINQGFILCAEYHEKTSQEEEILRQLEHTNIQIGMLEKQLNEAQQNAADALAGYEQAIRDSNENDIQKKLEGLKAYQKELGQELTRSQKQFNQFQKICEEIETLLREAVPYGFCVNEDLLPSNIQNMPTRRQNELELLLVTKLQALEKHLDQQRSEKIAEREAKKAQRQKLLKKIQTLETGKWVYPDGNCAQIVKDAINQQLSEQGMEPDAKIICELLYMKDASWQECVEACLGARRFDVIVQPDHYPAAKRAYQKLGWHVKQISLVHSGYLERALEKFSNVKSGTLAEKVSSENQLADAYVNDLLGNIICCETADTLEDHPHGATRDLLRRYPTRVARLRKPERYIGQEARQKQLEQAKMEETELKKDIALLEKEQENRRSLCARFQKALSNTSLEALMAGWNSETEYKASLEKFRMMEHEIQEYEHNPILLAVRSKIELRKKDYDEKNKQCTLLYSKLHQEREKAVTYQEKQQDTILQAETAQSAWQSYLEQYPLHQEEVEHKYQEAACSKSPQQIVYIQKNYQNHVERTLQTFEENELCPLQQEYNQLYTCDFRLGLKDLALYQDQYECLTHIELEKFSTDLQKAKRRCKERFRQDILYRLRDGIDDAKKQFRKLNRVMEKLAYGEESYHFSIGPSENARLADFYRLIEHSSNRQLPEEGTLEAYAYQPDQAYELQLNELMEHIMSDLHMAAEARQQGKEVPSVVLSSYVDYRQYLNCDIEITNAITQRTTTLSTVSGDSSGGENQAPFYVAICASMLQIYQQCPNSVRLVLLDEAFSKMTSDRIQPMMKMFRDMDLQVVLITTVEKASAIEPFCDITHSIIKKGSRNAICPFYRDGE